MPKPSSRNPRTSSKRPAAKASSAVLAQRRTRVAKIIPLLKAAYPHAKCSLDYRTPLQLLVATILSAQCTDVRVNMVTPALFAKYRTAADYAAADPRQLEREIQSTGFFRSKTRAIHAMAKSLIENFNGQVPRTMEELTSLHGVGRKTANVVLGNAFGVVVGIVVDTHVTRVANRLALTDHATDAVKIEKDLMQIVPQSEWTLFSHLLIHHGRAVCRARNPLCEQCPLLPYCPAGKQFVAASKVNGPRKKS
jgi:endonuclease-3